MVMVPSNKGMVRSLAARRILNVMSWPAASAGLASVPGPPRRLMWDLWNLAANSRSESRETWQVWVLDAVATKREHPSTARSFRHWRTCRDSQRLESGIFTNVRGGHLSTDCCHRECLYRFVTSYLVRHCVKEDRKEDPSRAKKIHFRVLRESAAKEQCRSRFIKGHWCSNNNKQAFRDCPTNLWNAIFK